jgi:hypothetical protein
MVVKNEGDNYARGIAARFKTKQVCGRPRQFGSRRCDRYGRRDLATGLRTTAMSMRLASRLGWATLYVAVISVVCVLGLEIAVRAYFRLPIFTLQDWRALQVNVLQSVMQYDALLGWTPASNTSAPFNTLEYGIRKNSRDKEVLTTDAILAVGDSYTAGSEVLDADTWPAQLEKMLGRRVINAGVMGYGVDQSVLKCRAPPAYP